MCSFASIDQNRLLPSFEASTQSSSSLYVPYCDLEKGEFLDSLFFSPLCATVAPSLASFPEGEDKDGCESFIRKKKRPEASFQFYKEYIRKRIEEAGSESVSPRQLFEEIKENGYLGAYSTVLTFVSNFRKKKGPEASFQFHREYIRKRIEEAGSESISTKELFEEIIVRGYQGTLRTVQTFASMTRIGRSPEASLGFHKEYIKKRLGKAAFGSVPTKKLFEEIKSKGYRGTLRTVQTFVSMIRESKAPEASFQFHAGYIKKRLEEDTPEPVSPRQLFEEIKESGYLGSYDTVRKSLPSIRKKKHKSPEESFQFHKTYISKRVREAAPESVSPRQLFEEIKAKGYLGAYNTVRAFASTIREKKNKRPEELLEFHKEYIKQRIKKAAPESVSVKELFEEIQAKGYRGTQSTVQTFVSMTRISRAPEELLQFHKKYIRKRLREVASESISTKQLFEEIKANGYLGVYSRVAAFVSTIRTSSSSEASL